MKLITVGTGSEQGNCYLVESDGKYISLDAGCSWKSVLVACGFNVYAIQAAFLSHVHGDHSAHAKDFIKNGIPVYTNAESAKKLNGACICKPNRKEPFWNDDWFVPFEVPHTDNDGITPCQNYAFLIEFNGERFLYMTDWMFCEYNLASFNINHFILAVNYTDLDANEGKSNHVLRGHSSLETAVDFLKTSMTESCKSISLCHLSDRNADEALILETIKQLAGDNIKVNICRKNEVIKL